MYFRDNRQRHSPIVDAEIISPGWAAGSSLLDAAENLANRNRWL
jgi:hypothetical protein